MSTVRTNNVQVGQSLTATNNFTLYQPTVPDGTVRLGVGNTGATTLDAVTVNNAGNVSVPSLTVNSNNISSVNSLGFRNRVINGDQRIDQRNAGAAVTFDGSNKYVTDRFFGFSNVGTTTSQQSTVAPTGFNNSLLATQTTGGSVVSSSFLALQHRVEGFNTADLGWGTASAQTVTLSFWVRSSVTGAFSVTLNNSAFNRSYVSNYTINAANTWEQKIITVPGDTSGTWLTNNGIGIIIIWNLGYGSNFTTSTLNSWIGSGVGGSTTATTAFATTTGATWQITGVQLEAGSVATPFERRDYGRELMMCQRYFETSNAIYTLVNNTLTMFSFRVSKRTQPTVALSAGSVSGGGYTGTDAFRCFGGGVDLSWTASAEL